MTTSSVAREIVEAVVLAMVVFLVIQAGVKNFKVLGASMQPTLENGQYLLVNKLVYFELDKERIARLTPFWTVDESSRRFAFSTPDRGGRRRVPLPQKRESRLCEAIDSVAWRDGGDTQRGGLHQWDSLG